MKTRSKPIVALASSAVLVCGLLCQSAQAQSIIIDPSTTVNLADVNGNNSGPTALPVTYEVTQFTSGPNNGLYDYTYNFSNPLGDPATVLDFTVTFNTLGSGALVSGSLTGGLAANSYGVNGVTWVTPTSPNSTSGPLSFMSDFAPVLGNANASGNDNPPGPWASDPAGSQVAVPNTVPEPATTSLLAMAFLVPAFGRGLFRLQYFKKT